MADKDIKDLPADLQKLFDSMFDQKTLQEIADWIRGTIYKRTKSGKGLSKQNRAIGGASNDKLKPLSDSYVQQRAKTVLGPLASPKRSNLTFTGELLESIDAYVKGTQVIVEIPNIQHGSGIPLQKLLDFVEEARPFFGLSDTEKKTLDSMISRMIRDKLRAANQK